MHLSSENDHALVTFSVVISTFNQRELLLETLESVTRQTSPAYEIIVVADGCTDGTAAAVRTSFPKVKLIDQPNLGKCIARNTGIIAASGTWVCLLDHDDLWHPEKLSCIAGAIRQHPGCGAFTHPVFYFSDPDGPQGGFGFPRDLVACNLDECIEKSKQLPAPKKEYLDALDVGGDSFERYLDRHIGPLSAAVIRRDVLMRSGMFCPMQFNGEDWTTFLNVSRLTDWTFVRERLGFTRLLESSGSYEPTGGIMLLATQANAWFTGRPRKHHSTDVSFLDELLKHRRRFRREIQGFYWEALFRRKWRIARCIRAFAQVFLERRWDRWYVAIPPQITWHVERLFSRISTRHSSAQPDETVGVRVGEA